MEILKDAIEVNKKALKDSVLGLKFLPILALLLIILNTVKTLIVFMVIRLLGSSFIVGFINYFIEMIALSLTLCLISEIVMTRSLDLKNILKVYMKYVSPLMNTFFYIYIFKLLMSMVIGNGGFLNNLSILISILFLILESPLLEEIYIDNSFGMGAINNAFRFVVDNIIPWGPIMILFIYTKLFLTSAPIFLFSLDLEYIARLLLEALILSFIYIYKGNLFLILSNSSVRKRKFQGMFR